MNEGRLAGRLALAWAGIVLAFAVMPVHELLGGTIGERETLATQAGHFLEFALLAGLLAGWACARIEAVWQPMAAAWLAATAYGALIEVLQMPLPYRSAQWGDLAMDAGGAGAGLLVLLVLRWTRCPKAPAGRRRAG